jgi:hypothetical protein
MQMEEDLVWIQETLGVEPLMYIRSVVKTSYDRGSILKWFFRSLGWWIENPWKSPMMTYLKNLRYSHLVDPSLYRQLIGSLMYLENTQLDIFFVGRLSYYIQLHGFIDSDWAGSAVDKRSATWIYFNLSFATMSWASRKQNLLHSTLQK